MNKKKYFFIFLIGLSILALIIVSVLILTDDNDDDNQDESSASTEMYSDYSNLQIELTRGACYGFCPDYELTVNEKGEVTFNGHAFVKKCGEYNYSVDSKAIEDLISEFEKVDFYNLEDSYMDIGVTDLPSKSISLTIDGKTKDIYLYGIEGTTVPKKLNDLADKIDNILEVSQYVGEVMENNCMD